MITIILLVKISRITFDDSAIIGLINMCQNVSGCNAFKHFHNVVSN